MAKGMANLKRLICTASPKCRYARFFYAPDDAGTGDLAFFKGGCNPSIVFRGDEVIRPEAGGPVIGLSPPSRYVERNFPTQPETFRFFFRTALAR